MRPGRANWANAGVIAVGDVAALALAAVAAHGAVHGVEHVLGWGFVGLSRATVERAAVGVPLAVAALLWLNAKGHYAGRIPFWAEARDLACCASLAVVAEGFIQYSVRDQVSRAWVVASWALAPACLAAVRTWMKWSLLALGLRQVGVALVGDADGSAAAALASERLLGLVVVAEAARRDPRAAALAVRSGKASLAVVAMGRGGVDRAAATAAALSREGVPFALCPPLGALGLASMRPLVLFGHESVLLVERRGLGDPLAMAAKRAVDVAAALCGLAVLGPFAALAAAAVATDGANPFFGHGRVGRDGRAIRVWKVRSMVPDAGARLERLLASDPVASAEWDRDRKLRDDPRTTAFGRFLRRSAVDEVPQLWNVLKGDMSLVGPRPVTPDEMVRYGDEARLYMGVRPGLTGLWQVSGRNSTTYTRRVELDAWYVRNWSLWVDAVIVVRTFSAVVGGRGAH